MNDLRPHLEPADRDEQRGAAPGVTGAQHPPGARGERDEGRGDEHEDEQLVPTCHPSRRAGPRQRMATPRQRSDDTEHDELPREQIEARRQHDVPHEQRIDGERMRPRGDALHPHISAEKPRKQPRDERARPRRERGRQPLHPHRVTHRRRCVREPDGERRLIVVPPRGRQHAKVQLVAVKTVARRRREQHDHDGQRCRSTGAPPRLRLDEPRRHTPPR